jgi:hypothetical protein
VPTENNLDEESSYNANKFKKIENQCLMINGEHLPEILTNVVM